MLLLKVKEAKQGELRGVFELFRYPNFPLQREVFIYYLKLKFL